MRVHSQPKGQQVPYNTASDVGTKGRSYVLKKTDGDIFELDPQEPRNMIARQERGPILATPGRPIATSPAIPPGTRVVTPNSEWDLPTP